MSTQDTTLPPLEQERVAFEKVESASNLARDNDEPECYQNPCVQSAWEGWQARADLAAQAPQHDPCSFMSRATYSTSSGAGYKQITFRFTELDDANQIRLWAMSYGAKAANHEVPKWPHQQAQGVAAPSVCDGKEQDAFEAWATGEKFDMQCHPLHWLFLNGETYAARQGWKAAIEYCAAALQAAPTPAPQALTDEQIDDLRCRYTDKLESREDIRALVNAAIERALGIGTKGGKP